MPKVKVHKTRSSVEFQRREGVLTAIIEVVSYDELHDGRGYAGRGPLFTQVLVVPMEALTGLLSEVTGALVNEATTPPDSDDSYNLVEDAEKWIGLFKLDAPEGTDPVASFYTMAEARAFSQPFEGKGFVFMRRSGPWPGSGTWDAATIIEPV